jgi:hypothetical protein
MLLDLAIIKNKYSLYEDDEEQLEKLDFPKSY